MDLVIHTMEIIPNCTSSGQVRKCKAACGVVTLNELKRRVSPSVLHQMRRHDKQQSTTPNEIDNPKFTREILTVTFLPFQRNMT